MATTESISEFALKTLDGKIIFKIDGEIIIGRENALKEYLAEKILAAQIDKICQNLMADKKIEIRLSDKSFAVLKENALKNLQNGGRGIGNVVESLFINPLARFLFDNEIGGNSKIFVDDIKISAIYPKLICS